MGIGNDAIGLVLSDGPKEGNEVTRDTPHIEKFDDKGMDRVGPITLKDGKEDIIDVLHGLIGVFLTGSGILDDPFTPAMS
jgi:hypothetical protein